MHNGFLLSLMDVEKAKVTLQGSFISMQPRMYLVNAYPTVHVQSTLIHLCISTSGEVITACTYELNMPLTQLENCHLDIQSDLKFCPE